MTDWKTSVLVATFCTLMAMSMSDDGHIKEKRSHRSWNDQDKVVRGAIGALLGNGSGHAQQTGKYKARFTLESFF